jgi:very-short-patch-repair endonuclease
LYLDGKLLAIPDAWWPEVSVAVEVDSQQWHMSPQDWQQTMERHDRMAAAGIRVLHFSPARIRTEPDVIIGIIRHALSVGAPSPRIQTKPAAT